MSKTPFMPLWVSDFLGDTLDLDATEVGAYLLLLMAQWNRSGGSLPDDDAKLKRIARCGRNWPKIWDVISRYFDRDGEGVYSRRLRQEAQNVAAKREVNAQSGARGGKAKALKTNNAHLANASETLQRNPSIPEPYREEDTVANATDGVAVDFAKAIFERGVKFLCGHGVKESQARSVVGKWRKDHSDKEIFDAFAECAKAGAIDPIPWMTARLTPQKPHSIQFDLSKFGGTA